MVTTKTKHHEPPVRHIDPPAMKPEAVVSAPAAEVESVKTVAPRVAVKAPPAETIGSPDIFLAEHHRQVSPGSVRIVQVKSDGPDRAYVISEGSKLGYFELSEGMPRDAAETALRDAYDGSAVVL